MKNDYYISVVTPLFNNEATLNTVLVDINKVLSKLTSKFEILIIDDKSIDNSVKALKTLLNVYPSIRLLRHEKNLGIAKTYRELYREARYDHIILFSLDGEWEPKDIMTLLKTAEIKKADIVIGERVKRAYSPTRLFISKVYNLINTICFGVTTKDAGSIKYMHKRVIESVPIVSIGVFDEAERIIRAKKMGFTVASVPVHHYPSKKTKALWVKPKLVFEALFDCVRVFISLKTQTTP